MDVITIESQAYKELVTKINAIAKFVVDHQDDDTVVSYPFLGQSGIRL